MHHETSAPRASGARPSRPPSTDDAGALEQRFRLLFGAVPLGIAYVHDDGRLAEVNDALLRMVGWDRDVLEQADPHFRELFPDPYGERLEDALRRAASAPFRPEEPAEAECLRSDGSRLPVLLGAAVDPDGPYRGVFFILDNSARKYAEQSQRFITEAGNVLASSLDYEQTLEQVAHLAIPKFADWCFVDLAKGGTSFERVVVAHADPEHFELAQSLRRAFPASPSSVGGWRSELFSDVTDALLAEQSKTRPHLEFLRGLDIVSYMVIPLVARQQLIGWLTFACSRFNYDGQNLVCAEELARRAALAIDNARLYRDAQDATRAREDFLSMASHELKTPLSSLKLQVQGLQRALRGEAVETLELERLSSGLEMMRRQVDRQAKLVDTLLDVSRISAGRLALEPESFDLAVLVGELKTRFESELTRSGTSLRVDCPRSLTVVWDRMRTDQVLTNLMSNAIKYGCRAPVNLTVELVDRGVERGVKLMVRDRGIGISENDRARIFGQFERAVSERNFGGFGLGLWITHRIVQAMGGTITVDSVLGSGSTFTVLLPQRSP